MIDFSQCRKINTLAFGGNNGLKIAIEYAGVPYMLKFPPHPKNTDEISYTNSCISEHIGCSIFNMLDIPAQETILGVFVRNGKQQTVVACKDFTSGNKVLLEFAKIKNSVLDSTHGGQGLDLEDVLMAIDDQDFFNPEAMKQRFWQMFVVDAYIGNFDRNNSNWGLLVDEDKQVSLAPVYDCGGCLYPQLNDESMANILRDKKEIENRIFVFPNSIYKQQNKKINYKKFLTTSTDSVCKETLKIITANIDEEKVDSFIDSIEDISEVRKNFYKTMLHYRKEWILDAALKGE